ncbi:MAG: exodeoxyribonuclease III [Acidimicrobiales bacterium]|jgi:exodeoxyribonuclease-3
MKIATWNVNSLSARMPRVVGWLEDVQPDVLCVQETKQDDAKFPSETFVDLGYEPAHFGDGRWNGVAILSRVGLDDVEIGFGDDHDELGCRLIAASCGGVRVYSVYVPNGRSLESEHYTRKLDWLSALRENLDERCDAGGKVAICGDFNVAPRDSDVWDPAHFEGMTHVSEPERRALGEVMDWGLVDVFTKFNEPGTFSWWDYRGGSFHKGHGMRIDLILVTRPLADSAQDAWVDRDARKGEKPSDHAPVVVELR